jgi:hypothetical protein
MLLCVIRKSQFVPERITTGILPSALRASGAVLIRSGRICQEKSDCFGKLLLRCSTTYVLVGDPGRSPLNHSYGYASAGDRPTLFAIFPLNFVPFMQHAG